jgi:hypothetical protein
MFQIDLKVSGTIQHVEEAWHLFVSRVGKFHPIYFSEVFWDTGTVPGSSYEYPLDFELARGNGVISFREMKKEFGSYPAIAGDFTKGG